MIRNRQQLINKAMALQMVRGYIECALWSSSITDESGKEIGTYENQGYALDDLSTEALKTAIEVCSQFFAENSLDIMRACIEIAYDLSKAGHDLWLTRNGHGAGFWDRGLGEIGTRLTDKAKLLGTADLFELEDGQIDFL